MKPKPNYMTESRIRIYPYGDTGHWWELTPGDDDLWVEYSYWEMDESAGNPVCKSTVSIPTDMVDVFIDCLHKTIELMTFAPEPKSTQPRVEVVEKTPLGTPHPDIPSLSVPALPPESFRDSQGRLFSFITICLSNEEIAPAEVMELEKVLSEFEFIALNPETQAFSISMMLMVQGYCPVGRIASLRNRLTRPSTSAPMIGRIVVGHPGSPNGYVL